MSVIEPDLPAGFERVTGNAYDHGGLPFRQSPQIPWVRGDDARDADLRPGENVDPLMCVTQAERIAPQETGEAIGGEKEWGGFALAPGGQLPVRV